MDTSAQTITTMGIISDKVYNNKYNSFPSSSMWMHIINNNSKLIYGFLYTQEI